MYVSDLDLITKARLQAVRDAAPRPPRTEARPAWMRRVADHLRRR